MDNFVRGDRAEEALRAAYPAEADPYTAIKDLGADLCHYARRHDIDPGQVLYEGIVSYAADCIEQAWKNSDDWHGTLQDDENLPRALEVLEVSGVPTAAYAAALVAVGLLDGRLRWDV